MVCAAPRGSLAEKRAHRPLRLRACALAAPEQSLSVGPSFVSFTMCFTQRKQGRVTIMNCEGSA
eukprot:859425-Prymnesium_polylepis.1